MSRPARPGARYWSPPPARGPRDLTPLQAGVAACVLDAMSNKQIAAAVDRQDKHVEAVLIDLRRRYSARNRVALALALERERVGVSA